MVMMEIRFSMGLVSSMIRCRATTNISTSSSVDLVGSQSSRKNSMTITMLNTEPMNLKNASPSLRCCQNSRNGSHKERMAAMIATKTMKAMIRSRKSAESPMVFLLNFLIR